MRTCANVFDTAGLRGSLALSTTVTRWRCGVVRRLTWRPSE
jgi:hypothetical protein